MYRDGGEKRRNKVEISTQKNTNLIQKEYSTFVPQV